MTTSNTKFLEQLYKYFDFYPGVNRKNDDELNMALFNSFCKKSITYFKTHKYPISEHVNDKSIQEKWSFCARYLGLFISSRYYIFHKEDHLHIYNLIESNIKLYNEFINDV